ncbi:MAG: oligosaccharide flippase family protein [Bryobacteraceae bacterium]
MLSAKTLGFAFSVFIPLCLVRVLPRFDFGLYKQAFLISGSAQSLLLLGVGMSAFYYLPREKDRQRQVVLNVVLFNLGVGTLAFLILLLWPGIVALILGGRELVGYAPWIGLAILTAIFSSFLEMVATAHQEVHYSTVFIVAAQITKSLFMVGAALLFRSVQALLVAAVLQSLIQSAVLVWYLQSRFPRFWSAFDWPMFRAQMAYAIPLGFAGVIYALLMDLHNYFVSNAFGPAALAIYAVGCVQLPVMGLLRESAGAVLIPRASHLEQRGARREIALLTFRVMRKLAIIYLPVYMFLLVSGREFLIVLFTRQYLDSWPIFVVNLTFLPLNIISYDHIIRAFARERYFLLVLRIASLAGLVAALWAGIAWFGMLGAILAVVLIGFIERVAISWRVVGILEIKLADLRLLADIGKLAALSLVAALVTVLARSACGGMKPLPLLTVSGFVFAVAYVAGLFAASLFTPDERTLMHDQWGHLKSLLGLSGAPRRG